MVKQALPGDFDFAASGRRVIEIETRGLVEIAGRIDGAFSEACRLLLGSRGRVACSGMGKSGHIARKIAATFASRHCPDQLERPPSAAQCRRRPPGRAFAKDIPRNSLLTGSGGVVPHEKNPIAIRWLANITAGIPTIRIVAAVQPSILSLRVMVISPKLSSCFRPERCSER